MTSSTTPLKGSNIYKDLSIRKAKEFQHFGDFVRATGEKTKVKQQLISQSWFEQAKKKAELEKLRGDISENHDCIIGSHGQIYFLEESSGIGRIVQIDNQGNKTYLTEDFNVTPETEIVAVDMDGEGDDEIYISTSQYSSSRYQWSHRKKIKATFMFNPFASNSKSWQNLNSLKIPEQKLNLRVDGAKLLINDSFIVTPQLSAAIYQPNSSKSHLLYPKDFSSGEIHETLVSAYAHVNDPQAKQQIASAILMALGSQGELFQESGPFSFSELNLNFGSQEGSITIRSHRRASNNQTAQPINSLSVHLYKPDFTLVKFRVDTRGVAYKQDSLTQAFTAFTSDELEDFKLIEKLLSSLEKKSLDEKTRETLLSLESILKNPITPLWMA